MSSLAADARLPAFGQPLNSEINAVTSTDTVKSTASDDNPTAPAMYIWDVAARKLIITSALQPVMRSILEILNQDPTSANAEYRTTSKWLGDGWDVHTDSTLRISLTQDALLLTAEVKAYERDKEIFAKIWNRKISRQWV